MSPPAYIVGCIINLCGSIVINIGTNLIKYHHTLINERLSSTITKTSNLKSDHVSDSPDQKDQISQTSQAPLVEPPPRKSIWWYLGFTLFFLGNVANFISMGFAAQSLLAGLGSIQFITNVVCSALIMKHKITQRIVCATFAIVVGNMLIVAFASHQSTSYTVFELWDLYFEQAYEIYCILLVVLILILYVYYKEMKKKLKQSVPAGIKVNLNVNKSLPFSYAAISAIIGTQSVLLAKSSSELVRTTISGNNQFVHPFTYFIIIAWIVCMVFWLYRMNAALRKFDGVFIIPVLQVVWTLFSIVGGGIYFKEFSSFTALNIALFTTGVFIVMLGVYLLAPQSNTQSHMTIKGSSEQTDLSYSQHFYAVQQSHSHSSGAVYTFEVPIEESLLIQSQPPQVRQILGARLVNGKYAMVLSTPGSAVHSNAQSSNNSNVHLIKHSRQNSQSRPESPMLLMRNTTSSSVDLLRVKSLDSSKEIKGDEKYYDHDDSIAAINTQSKLSEFNSALPTTNITPTLQNEKNSIQNVIAHPLQSSKLSPLRDNLTHDSQSPAAIASSPVQNPSENYDDNYGSSSIIHLTDPSDRPHIYDSHHTINLSSVSLQSHSSQDGEHSLSNFSNDSYIINMPNDAQLRPNRKKTDNTKRMNLGFSMPMLS